MQPIRIAIVGVGNCASSLIQGLTYYPRHPEAPGLMHAEIGGYTLSDIEVAAAFDVDHRKVGLDVAEAIFIDPNCAARFEPDVPMTGVKVQRGPLLDGLPQHMQADAGIMGDEASVAEMGPVISALQDSGARVLVNYLPVGSEQATQFYARCAIEAGMGMVNCIPVFIASDETWARRFTDATLPVIGDDVKSQYGATILHRMLIELARRCGLCVEQTYQLNVGGNGDFLNMANRQRLSSKKRSKTEAVQAVAGKRFDDAQIHIGPSDYVPFLRDNKVCYIRLEGRGFGDTAMELELRLSVQDSPNSAGVVVDAIRCCQLALDRGLAGPIESACAALFKSPPLQMPDDHAWRDLQRFIEGR